MRSLSSCRRCGITGTRISSSRRAAAVLPSPQAACIRVFCSASPKKMERMAGGASLAPSRWSLPAVATVMRSSAWYSSTAVITAASISR